MEGVGVAVGTCQVGMRLCVCASTWSNASRKSKPSDSVDCANSRIEPVSLPISVCWEYRSNLHLLNLQHILQWSVFSYRMSV